MYFLQALGPEVEALNKRAKDLVRALCEKIPPVSEKLKIPTRQDVYSAPDRQGKLYRLVDGTLSYARGDKVLFYFDPGDLVGVEQFLIGTSTKVLSDFAVVVDAYDAQEFIDAAHADQGLNRLWTEYLALNHGMLSALVGNLFKDEISSPPDINAYSEGKVIIDEGTRAEGVHLLIDGVAEVRSSETPLGTISPGELFGVVSALSGIPWSSSIVALEPCMVMTLPKENFQHLVETRPSAYLKQIEDMARLMVDLGDQNFRIRISNF
jgi:hypothetical protein